MKVKYLSEHKQKCNKAPVTCGKCEINVIREELPAHDCIASLKKVVLSCKEETKFSVDKITKLYKNHNYLEGQIERLSKQH